MSQETQAFWADLYIDGKKAGVAYNSWHDSPTDYEAHNTQGIKLITEAEAYCLNLRTGVRECFYTYDEPGSVHR